MHDRCRLSRQIDSRLLCQTELFEIFVIVFHAQPLAQFNEDGITAVHNACLERLRPVSACLRAPDSAILHQLIAGTVELICQRHHALLERCRRRDNLKCGTRLIGVADTRVSPHAVQQFLLFVRRLRPIRSHLLN